MTCISLFFAIPLIVYLVIDPLGYAHFELATYHNLYYLLVFGLSLYFCKDSLNGQSYAKRKYDFQVIDRITGQPASPLKCLVRNIFCLVWPVEVLVSPETMHKRIGDKITGTELVKSPRLSEVPKVKYGQVALCVCISFAVHAGVFFLIF
ncbi:RDD family protein [Filimonas lacunae]|nr:hypothetical protein [Filimonas lacunae]